MLDRIFHKRLYSQRRDQEISYLKIFPEPDHVPEAHLLQRHIIFDLFDFRIKQDQAVGFQIIDIPAQIPGKFCQCFICFLRIDFAVAADDAEGVKDNIPRRYSKKALRISFSQDTEGSLLLLMRVSRR